MNPIEQFLAWYAAVAPEVRETVSYELLQLAPDALFGVSAYTEPAKRHDEFVAAIAKNANHRAHLLGTALIVCSLVDFVVRPYSTREQWDAAIARNEAMARAAEENGQTPFAQMLRQENSDLPRRATVWLKDTASWKELRASALSCDGIEAWRVSSLTG